MSHNRIVMVLSGSDITGYDMPCVDPKMQPKVGFVRFVEVGQRCHHFERRGTGAFSVVFMRYRRPKERNDFVADKLVDRPSKLLNNRNRMFKVSIEKVACSFRIE